MSLHKKYLVDDVLEQRAQQRIWIKSLFSFVQFNGNDKGTREDTREGHENAKYECYKIRRCRRCILES